MKKIQRKTFFNPLELMYLVKSPGKNLQEKIDNYWSKRFKEIEMDHLSFYSKILENKQLDKFLDGFLNVYFLEKKGIMADDHEKIYHLYLDKKYIYIDEDGLLKTNSLIAKKVLEIFYLKELSQFDEQKNKFLLSIPEVLSKTKQINQNNATNLSGSGRGALFETYINTIFQINAKTQQNLLYYYFDKTKKQLLLKDICFEYGGCNYFSPNTFFIAFEQMKTNQFLIPNQSNFENIDSLFWNNEENTFYLIQITINFIKNQKVDKNFENSSFANDLKIIKKGCSLQFIWVVGPSELTSNDLFGLFQNNTIDHKSWIIFPKDNRKIFKNLEFY